MVATSLSITLPRNLERFAREAVSAGRFASIDEVIATALRLLEVTSTPTSHADFERLRVELNQAAAQADRGDFVSPDETLARIQEMKNAMETRRA